MIKRIEVTTRGNEEHYHNEMGYGGVILKEEKQIHAIPCCLLVKFLI